MNEGLKRRSFFQLVNLILVKSGHQYMIDRTGYLNSRYPLDAKASLRVQRKTFDRRKDRERREFS